MLPLARLRRVLLLQRGGDGRCGPRGAALDLGERRKRRRGERRRRRLSRRAQIGCGGRGQRKPARSRKQWAGRAFARWRLRRRARPKLLLRWRLRSRGAAPPTHADLSRKTSELAAGESRRSDGKVLLRRAGEKALPCWRAFASAWLARLLGLHPPPATLFWVSCWMASS